LEYRSDPSAPTVDDYIAAQPSNVRTLLTRVRAAIRRGMPQAEEVMLYAMPTYRVGKRRVIAFAVWKEHLALYCKSESIVATFGGELQGCTFEKGTVRFPLTMPISDDLIERVARLRASESAR